MRAASKNWRRGILDGVDVRRVVALTLIYVGLLIGRLLSVGRAEAVIVLLIEVILDFFSSLPASKVPA